MGVFRNHNTCVGPRGQNNNGATKSEPSPIVTLSSARWMLILVRCLSRLRMDVELVSGEMVRSKKRTSSSFTSMSKMSSLLGTDTGCGHSTELTSVLNKNVSSV